MDTQAIRTAFLQAPVKQEDVILPDWLAPLLEPGTELIIKDVSANEIGLLQKQAQRDPAQTDVQMSAAIIVRCLASKATGELIFQPADRDAIASLGATKLANLSQQIGTFFGFAPKPVEEAKKN